MRLEPACVSMSATCADSTSVGSRCRIARLGVGVDLHAVQLEQPGDHARRRGSAARCAARSGVSPSSAATIAFETKFLAPRTVIVARQRVATVDVQQIGHRTIVSHRRACSRPHPPGTPRAGAKPSHDCAGVYFFLA